MRNRNDHDKKLYQGHMLTRKEKRLMQVLFEGGATQKDIELFTKNLDVDTASSDYMLMLSYLGLSSGWRWFPKEMVPRMQGLHRYYQVRNVLGVNGLIERIRLLRQAGIPVMFLKGMAMRYYYASGVPRIMSDMDLLVPEESLDAAVKILCQHGGVTSIESAHSIHVVNGPASIDLHRWMFKSHGEGLDKIWERAIPVDFYGQQVYVPSPEDMFVHLLDTRARAIIDYEGITRRMRWLYDCNHIVWKGSFDWDAVIDRIGAFHAENTAYLMLRAYADCFPKTLSVEYVDSHMPPSEEYEEWLRLALANMKIKRAYGLADERGDFLYSIRLWPRYLYMDYRYQQYNVKGIEKEPLTWKRYLLKRYHAENPGEALQKIARNVKRKAGLKKVKER